MALSKRITLANGITTNYHRVMSVNTITNNQNIIEVTSYTSKAKRAEEKAFYDQLATDRQALADAEAVESAAYAAQAEAVAAEQAARDAYEAALEALGVAEAAEDTDEQTLADAREAVAATESAYAESRDKTQAASTALGTANQAVEQLRMLNREWPQIFTETTYANAPYDQSMTIEGAYEWIKANVADFEGVTDVLEDES